MTDFVYVNDLPEDDTPSADARALFVNEAGTELVQGPTWASSEAELDGKVDVTGDTMTGPLTVPALTATGNVDMTSNVPYIFFTPSGGTANERRFALLADSVSFFVRSVNDDGSTNRNIIRIRHALGQLDMTGAASVKLPAPTGASQAAQTTAIDATTGRMAINGYEIGDTGERAIPETDLLNSWTSTTGNPVVMQRAGNMVTVAVQGLGGQDNTSAAFLNVPSGFRPADAAFARTAVADQTGGVYRLYMGGNALALTTLSANVGGNPTTDIASLFFSISYATADPWPSSLPGTAVRSATTRPGTNPNLRAEG